jgi:hypothetical protein
MVTQMSDNQSRSIYIRMCSATRDVGVAFMCLSKGEAEPFCCYLVAPNVDHDFAYTLFDHYFAYTLLHHFVLCTQEVVSRS